MEAEDAISLSSDQLARVSVAQEKALKNIDNILSSVDNHDETFDILANNAKELLGLNINSVRDANRLKLYLQKMQSSLSSMKDSDYKYDPNPRDPEITGYVESKDYMVFYGDSLFKKNIYLTKTGLSGNLVNTLLHESSHKALNLNSEKEFYKLDDCLRLPNQMKMLNASNWSYFIGGTK